MFINKDKIDLSLYLVTDRRAVGDRDYYTCIEQALKGGVSILQLREKSVTGKEFYAAALKVKALCQHYHVPLIINDRVDIALAVNADGVHLGPDDIPISKARDLLGQDKIIGASARTLEMALDAVNQGADYLGCGAMFKTSTKQNTTPMSMQCLRGIKKSVNLPIVAIGGITTYNIESILRTDINGYAISSGILKSHDIYQETKKLASIILKG